MSTEQFGETTYDGERRLMPAKLSPAQQRDRRAKIMLAVLGVVLLAVVALQAP